MGETLPDLHGDDTETGAFSRACERPSDHTGVPRSLREREQGDQIKRISTPESNSGEISESGINPESSQLNSISSFGSRSEQISASRKPLFLDTTLCLKKQLTRVFNGPNHVEEHTDDIAMINTINFDDLLLGEVVSHSTSTAPMDMIEEEVENLTTFPRPSSNQRSQ